MGRQKLKVFLSSKIDGNINGNDSISYKEFREKVSRFLVNKLGIEIKKFEHSTPSSESPQRVYLKALQESDIYLGFFGPEYSPGTIEEFLNDACYNPYVFLLCTQGNNVFMRGLPENDNRLNEVKNKLKKITYSEKLNCEEIESFLKNSENSKLGEKLKNIISEEIAIKKLFNLFPEDAIKGGELKVLYHHKIFINKQNIVNRCLNCRISLIIGPSGSGKTALLRQCIYEYIYKYIREQYNKEDKDNKEDKVEIYDLNELTKKEELKNIHQEDPLFFFDNIQEINKSSLEMRVNLIKDIVQKFPKGKIILTVRTDQKGAKDYIENIKNELKEFKETCTHDLSSLSFNQSDIELLSENFRFLRKQWLPPLAKKKKELEEVCENIESLSGGLIGDIVEILNHIYSELIKDKKVNINSLSISTKGNLNRLRWKRIRNRDKNFLKYLSLFKGWVGIEVVKRIYSNNFPHSDYIKDHGIKIKIYPDRFRDYIYNNKLDKKFKATNHEKVLTIFKDLLNEQKSQKGDFTQELRLFNVYNYTELKKIAPNKVKVFYNFLKDIGIWLENMAPFTAIEVLNEYYSTIISQNINREDIDFDAIYKLIDLIRMYGDIDKAINISDEVLPIALQTSHKCNFLGNHIRLLQRKSLEEAVKYIESEGDKLSECYDDPIFSNLIARLYRDLGNFKRAEEYASNALGKIESYSWKDKNEKIKRKAEIHYTLGSILVYNGEYNVARIHLAKSIESRQYVNDHQGVPYCYYTIALSFLAENSLQMAIENLNKAKEYMETYKIKDSRMEFKLKILDLWIEFKRNFRTLKRDSHAIENLFKRARDLEKKYSKHYEGKDGNELRLLEAFLLFMQGQKLKYINDITGIDKIRSRFLKMEYENFKSRYKYHLIYSNLC